MIPEKHFLDIVFHLALGQSHGQARSNQRWHFLLRKQSIKQLVLLLAKQSRLEDFLFTWVSKKKGQRSSNVTIKVAWPLPRIQYFTLAPNTSKSSITMFESWLKTKWWNLSIVELKKILQTSSPSLYHRICIIHIFNNLALGQELCRPSLGGNWGGC